MKVHFIQHDDWVEPGEYLSWAERNGYDVSFTRCWRYENPPEEVTADLLIILGGCQCPVTSKEECDYFDPAAEQRLIRKYVEARHAVIGVCLGAQLIGEALGAPYEQSPEKEIGPVRARLTGAGRIDPFLVHFPDIFEAGEWHNDMPGLTDDAVILAESDGSRSLTFRNRLQEMNSLSANIANICAGIGYGYLSESVVNAYIAQGLMKKYNLYDPFSELNVVFVYRRDRIMDAAFLRFLDMLQADRK